MRRIPNRTGSSSQRDRDCSLALWDDRPLQTIGARLHIPDPDWHDALLLCESHVVQQYEEQNGQIFLAPLHQLLVSMWPLVLSCPANVPEATPAQRARQRYR